MVPAGSRESRSAPSPNTQGRGFELQRHTCPRWRGVGVALPHLWEMSWVDVGGGRGGFRIEIEGAVQIGIF